MTAIVTNNIKKQLIETVLAEVADSANYYYVGFGKSDQWGTVDTPPTTINSEREKRNFRAALQSIIRTTDASMVVPRYNWTSGTIYNAYTDNNTSNTNYYILSDNNRVYMCLQQGKNAEGISQTSTVNPDTIGTTLSAQATSDGYVWKYLYTLSALDTTKYLSANYMSVQKVDSADNLTVIQETQLNVQKAADSGEVVGYRIVDGGTGYTSAPTLTIQGSGSGAKAVATISEAGVLSKVEVKDSGGTLAFGSGYSYANVSLSGGNARVLPIISKNGVGRDARDDLNAVSVMFNAKPSGTQNGAFIVDNDFRQIGLIKNPVKNNDSDFTGTEASALKVLTLSGITGFDSDNSRDALITGDNSGARAYVDDLRGSTFLYHQNESTGYTPFETGEVIANVNDSSNTATIVSDSDGLILNTSGEILYIENRNPVIRDVDQTEDIKIVIKL